MALQNLRTHFQSANINGFMSMLDSSCVVSEKIQASSFHIKKTKEGFEYFKSGSRNSMDRIDRTMVKYYENGIKYFNTILKELKEDMPLDWKFGFDYMLDNKTIDIEYDTLPKNHLILTHIQVLKPNDLTQVKKVIRDPSILNKWADLLGVQRPPIIFQGKLQLNQKEDLIRLLEISDKEFEIKYESESFTRYIYNIFNNQ